MKDSQIEKLEQLETLVLEILEDVPSDDEINVMEKPDLLLDIYKQIHILNELLQQ